MPNERLKVLIVEDDDDVAQTVKNAIEERINSECFIENSFEQALAIVGPHFDIVVLDQMKGPPKEGKVGARPIWQQIHEDSFVPVVIYSAAPIAIEDEFPENNPILRYVEKGGQKSEETLANHLLSGQHIYQGFKQLKKELSKVMLDVFLKVAPVLVSPPPKQAQEVEMQAQAKHLVRAARRRLAAMMDLQTLAGEDLLAWEQYLCPPLSNQWLTGDILHANGTSAEDPANYRVLLTPSCDLPRPPDGKAKVDEVLVCKCVPVREFIERTKTKQKQTEFEKDMPTALNRGHAEGLLPLPSYHGKIPSMAAKLKVLELVPLADIGDKRKYSVVASIDSPFREQIGWAFIETNGRPGVPPRNLTQWANELWEELQKQKSEKAK